MIQQLQQLNFSLIFYLNLDLPINCKPIVVHILQRLSSKKLQKDLDVHTPYLHPTTLNSQGVVERFNAIFKQQLGKFTNDHYDDWDIYLKTIISSYNSAVHQVT